VDSRKTLNTLGIPLSRHRQVGVLEHFQPAGVRAHTHVPKNVAEDLVRRMVAERVSQKVIRMFPPGSVFASPIKAALPATRYIPEKLPPAEIEGTRFQPPEVTVTVTSTIPRLHLLPRYRPVYGENQLRISL
jgi:hypothetical protein